MSNLKLSQFNYNLPEKLIAQKPKAPRDHCRLLVLDKNPSAGSGQEIQHKKFFEIEKFLRKGDVVVLNDSKVIPARLYGKKSTGLPAVALGLAKEGGNVEILLIKKVASNKWEALLKNFKSKESGKTIIITKNFIATPEKNIEGGLWLIKFNAQGEKLQKLIHKYGQTPLPPYIKKSAKLKDYQTIYAQNEGSVAAPTAGLHFTKQLINELKKKGIIFETITLHVGLGTFSPIREENIEKHKMHSEWAEISAKTAKAINKAKAEGRRVIAVGTTSVRTLEYFSDKILNSKFYILYSGQREVDIFINPGYKFKIVDAIITNFHLPQTTLMILVAAFARQDNILKAYQEAIKKKYKFFSFGDAMLII